MTMQADALEDLKLAFAEWRRGKKHAREAVPEGLLVRARRVAHSGEREHLFREGEHPFRRNVNAQIR